MNNWKVTTLGEIGKIITGKTPSINNPEHWGEFLDFITPSDIKTDSKYLRNVNRKLSKIGSNAFGRMVIPRNSVIVTCIGSDMGKVIVNKENCVTNQQINSLIINSSFDADFVYYLLKNSYRILRVNAEGGGSTMPIINKSAFENLSFLLPPIEEQKQIAAVLSSLDDKIELLRAQNETLEKIAQGIFKEWFVDFKINGKKLKLKNGVPEGWGVGKLGKLVKHSKDGIDPSKEPLITFKHFSLPAFDKNKDPEESLGKTILSGKYLVKEDCFLVSKLNPKTPRIWTIIEPRENSICSTEFQIVVPKENKYFCFVYSILRSDNFTRELASKAKGTSSSHQRVNPRDIFDYSMIIPPNESIAQFDNCMKFDLSKIENNNSQIQTISRLRDTLLPKLMNGKIKL